jgi:small subunit ribosomal protein S1
VRHPSEVLRVNEEVEVYVLGINEDERKIALSLKRTQAEPWTRVAARYEVGQLVKGTITQLANFGAFARIEDGIEGLIHVSELSDDRVAHPRNIVKEGDELMLRIIRIDPQRRRMGLSLRRALEFTEQDALEGYVQDNLGAPVKPEELEERNRRNDEMLEERARMDAEEADAEAAEGVDYNDDAPLTATIAESTEAGEETSPSPDPEAVTEALEETEAKAASGDVAVLAHGNVTMDDPSEVGEAVSAAGAEEPMPAEAKH